MKFNLDLTGKKFDQLDRGRSPEAGWYKCVLDDMEEDSKTGQCVFHWKVLAASTPALAAYVDAVIYDRVGNPELADDDRGAETALRRIRFLGKRLKLIKPEDEGKQVEVDFADAINAEAVIHVEHRRYKDRAGNDAEIDSVKFDGVYPLDHQKIPADVRAALGLPAVEGGAPATTAAPAEKPKRGGGRAAKPANGEGAATNRITKGPIDVSDL